jgi:FkbM family methyltransferase
VIAFEPDPHHFALLAKNCALNGCTNVEMHNMALGSGRELLPLHKEILNSGNNFLGSSVSPHPNLTMEVDVVSIDEFLPELQPDLVKIDVQGWEFKVLRGMERMLAANPKTALFIEFWPVGLRRAGCSPGDLLDYLAARNFRIFFTDGGHDAPLESGDLADLALRPKHRRHIDLYAMRKREPAYAPAANSGRRVTNP